MIDVNGTRHHLLLGDEDWLPRLASEGRGVAWDSGSHTVGLRPREQRLPLPEEAVLLGAEHRRGASADRWSNIYWISDDELGVRYLPADQEAAGDFWRSQELLLDREPAVVGDFEPCPVEPLPQPPRLRGLAITRCHYMVVGSVEPAGLLIFDLHAGGPPLWLRWPAGVPFAPFDIAPHPDGGVLVLDRDGSRLWRLDRWFGVVALGQPPGTLELEPAAEPDFLAAEDKGGVVELRPARRFPSGLDLDLAAPLGIPSAVAVVAMPDGSALVLESDPASSFSHLHRFHGSGKLAEVSLEGILDSVLAPDAEPAAENVAGQDLVFVAGPQPAPGERGLRGRLYVASRAGGQAFAFDLQAGTTVVGDDLSLVPLPRLFPMRDFGGKALLASPGAGGGHRADVLYDLGDRWLPLAPWPGRRFDSSGVVQSLIFDGKVPGTVWHRLVLDACVPAGTAITVDSRSADERHLLDDLPFRPEPSSVLRVSGSELPYHRPFGDQPASASGSWELLFQEARGRYVELRLTLTGDGRSSPRLRALRVHYPRFSYLGEYLPAVFGEDADSASFLDRFLSSFEGLLTTLEGKVASAEQLFDVRTAPADSLPWLAGWLGTVLQPEWDESRRRLFLANVAELFRWRGTPAGLLAAVRLAVDPCPSQEIFDVLPTANLEGRCRTGPAASSSEDRADNGGSSASAAGSAGVRLVERYRTRMLPPVALGDPTDLEGPALVTEGEPWRPEHGAAALHRRYRDFLRCRGAEATAATRFPPLPPATQGELTRWRAFVRTLGFPYAEVSADATGPGSDVEAWRAFLFHRYRSVDDLELAYRRSESTAWSSFDEVPLPTVLPEVPQELADWIGFVSLALPLTRDAHRFTVLVPARPGEAEPVRELRRARAAAAVEQQKPAHTEFDVQLFWALFQVGGARLGLDTVLAEGSRFVGLVLGRDHLGTAFLADRPWRGDPDCCLPPRPTLDSDPSACEPRLETRVAG
ncbi:MAG: phage tail protein [Thermoanaerobaculia bacterium]|nr:phage tail protein [Thermoanaerobaculia bacterium]